MKYYKISEEVVKALLGYLYSRPFSEVEAGVVVLRNLEEIKEPDSVSQQVQD